MIARQKVATGMVSSPLDTTRFAPILLIIASYDLGGLNRISFSCRSSSSGTVFFVSRFMKFFVGKVNGISGSAAGYSYDLVSTSCLWNVQFANSFRAGLVAVAIQPFETLDHLELIGSSTSILKT